MSMNRKRNRVHLKKTINRDSTSVHVQGKERIKIPNNKTMAKYNEGDA